MTLIAPTDALSQHAVDTRNGFLPPRYVITHLQSEDSWATIPPVPLLVDIHGEEIPPRASCIQLAYDAQYLYLRAHCVESSPVVKSELPLDSAQFWTQDHIELRLLTDPARPLEQIHFIIAADGRCWDNQGFWKRGDSVHSADKVYPAGWAVSFRVPFAALRLPTPTPGTVLRGITAHLRWAAGWPDIAGISATELGFSQAERFAEFVFASPTSPNIFLQRLLLPAGKLALGSNPTTVMLTYTDETPVNGILRCRRETEAATTSESVQLPVTLHPDANTVAVDLMLARPQFTRFRFSLELDGLSQELGAITLRAGVPDLQLDQYQHTHPYLLFSEAQVVLLRRKMENPAFAPLRSALQRELQQEVTPPEELCAAGHAEDQLMKLAAGLRKGLIGWILTGEQHYAQEATAYVRAADALVLGRYTDLHEGMCSSLLALAYDAFYPALTAEERSAWQQTLAYFLQLHLNTSRERHWNATTIANANSVCNGGGGLVALALLHEHPEAPESLYLTRKFIRQYLDYCYGAEGGCTEGVQYWDYGMTNFLRFAVAMEGVLGADDGLLSHPAVTQCANNLRVSLTNDGKMHGVNDTIPMAMCAEIGWFLAARFGDALGGWWGDWSMMQHEKQRTQGKSTPYAPDPLFGSLFRPDVPLQTAQPPLPTAYVLHDIQYGILRSNANVDCALVAGLKGSRPPYTHHNQPDTGSFYLDVRGERLLIDPGYYKDAPTDHSLPIINGTAPAIPEAFVGEIIACLDAGDLRYLACDATAAYRGQARRVVRHLLLAGEEGAVLLDDIDADGEVLAQYQAGGVTEEQDEGRAILIHGQQAKVQLALLTHQELRLTCHPERTFHDTHWGYHFAECRWFPLRGSYLADAAVPLVTVFLDATRRQPGKATLRRETHTLTVTLPSQRTFTFAYFQGQWRLDY